MEGACFYDADNASESEHELRKTHQNIRNIEKILEAYGGFCNDTVLLSQLFRAETFDLLSIRLRHMKVELDSESAAMKALIQMLLIEQKNGGNCIFCIIRRLVSP